MISSFSYGRRSFFARWSVGELCTACFSVVPGFFAHVLVSWTVLDGRSVLWWIPGSYAYAVVWPVSGPCMVYRASGTTANTFAALEIWLLERP